MNTQLLIDKSLNVSTTLNDNLDPSIVELAQAIAERHGRVKIVKEQSGIHIYFPSPYVVESEGKKEVYRHYPHGALNAEKYLGIGRFANIKNAYNRNKNVASCMKTGKSINVRWLMDKVKPIEERIGEFVEREVQDQVMLDEELLVEDENGNLVPRAPGLCTPVIELDEDHPARLYLADRGFENLAELHQQFQLSYCHTEEPEDRSKGIYYRRLPAGFKDTPQGRLIFYAIMDGVRVGWQARILDMEVEGGLERCFWHPYRNEWVVMEQRDSPEDKWQTLPGLTDDYAWDYSKYKTGRGTRRNSILMGLDAARLWNRVHGRDGHFVLGLCEGPLDAGRVGPPLCPLLGKSISDNQAKIIIDNFERVIYFGDNDEAGLAAKKKVAKALMGKVGVTFAKVPGKKDLGALPRGPAMLLWNRYLEAGSEKMM